MMIKQLLFIILLALSQIALADDMLQSTRKLFFEFGSNKHAAQSLYEQLSAKNNKSPVLTAYEGVALATTASHSFNPMTKWNRFSEGRKLVEQAIAAEPANAEIRLIRMSIQIGAPAFLGYSNEVDADATLIVESLEKDPNVFGDRQFTQNVILFLQSKLPAKHSLQGRVSAILTKM